MFGNGKCKIKKHNQWTLMTERKSYEVKRAFLKYGMADEYEFDVSMENYRTFLKTDNLEQLIETEYKERYYAMIGRFILLNNKNEKEYYAQIVDGHRTYTSYGIPHKEMMKLMADSKMVMMYNQSIRAMETKEDYHKNFYSYVGYDYGVLMFSNNGNKERL